MKKYGAPEREKIEYEVEECLGTSGIGKESGDITDIVNGI